MIRMQRRDFLKSTVAVAVAAELGMGKAQAKVATHNWINYDFGLGPHVPDRLNQGPFPQYPPDAVIPTDDVVMTTTPSEDVVPNYGKGLVTYITADSGTEEIKADNIPRAIEDLVRFPLGEQLYIRPTWREVQPRPGRLELPDYVKLVFDLANPQQARRVPGADVRSRLYPRSGSAGFCARQGAESRSGAEQSGEQR
jgi:hypothetical protein